MVNVRPAVVFGDCHGKADQLKSLIKIVRERFGAEVDIYSVGDLIDRGSGSKEVIQICIDENIKAQMGNHEQWLVQVAVNKVFEPFALTEIMGGKFTVESYGVDSYSNQIAKELFNKIPDSHKNFLKNLPNFRRIMVGDKHYWLIHAGLQSSVGMKMQVNNDDGMMAKISKQNPDSILWVSPNVSQDDNLYHFKDAVQIFGHKPVKNVIVRDHFIALDTGCGTCAPYNLSAIILPTMEVITVPEILDWE